MRILYLHSTPLDSEKANLVQVLNMCNAFCRVGHNVTLITRSSGNRNYDTIESIAERFGMGVLFDLRFFEGGFSILGRLKEIGALFSNVRERIHAELRGRAYDAVFIRSPIFMPLIKKIKVPVVYELHNDTLHYDSKILNEIWSRMFLRYTKSGIIKKVVVISEALKKIWTQKGVEPDRIFAYHDGFNPAHYREPLSKQEARKNLGARSEACLITYTGSLYKDRGIELILQAAQAIPHALFYIIGGPMEQVYYYSRLSKRYGIGNIVFTGRVDQKKVSQYLFASDILLLIFTDRVPTIDYCSPLKMFEYMASGRTILGHGFPTIQEVLKHGQDAVLVDPYDNDDFISTLKNLVGTHTDHLGDNARREAFAKYSWEKRAEAVAHFLSN